MSLTFPIETDRLLIRPFKLEDTDAKFRLDSDPDIQKYLGGSTIRERSARLLETAIEEFERQGYGLVALVETATCEIIGYATLQREPSRERLELVLAVLPQARKKEFAFEAAKALISAGCAGLQEKEIVGRVNLKNIASLRLVEKLGMRKIGERTDPLDGSVEYIYIASCLEA